MRGPEGPLGCIDSDKWSTDASLAWVILNNGDSSSRINHHDQSTDTELEKCHKSVQTQKAAQAGESHLGWETIHRLPALP